MHRDNFVYQPFSKWEEDEDRISILHDGEPESIDLLRRTRLAVYRRLRRWTCDVGTNVFAFELFDPVPAAPDCPLSDPSCPTLMILDEMRRLGWRPARRRVNHDAGQEGPHDFDCRRLVGDKTYM